MTRLKELREEKEITQAQLAKVIGVNYRTISQYETGIIEPSIEIIKKLCEYFGVSADYLLEMKDY